jgi:hypothetical protein
MPFVAIGAAVGAAVGGFTFGITGAVIGAIAGGGLMLASSAMQKMDAVSATYQADQPQSTASTVQPVQIVFGSVGVAGNFLQSTESGGADREIVVAFGKGPMKGAQRIRYNKKDMDRVAQEYSKLPTLIFKPGSNSETVPDSGDFPGLHDQDKLYPYRNTATLWMRITGKDFTQSGQNLLITLEGLKCWTLADTGVREFSRNPAVIAATYLRDFKRKEWADIDVSAFQSLQGFCEDYFSETDDYSEDLIGAGSIEASHVHAGDEITYAASNVFQNNTTFWASGPGNVECNLQYDFGECCGVRIARYEFKVDAEHNWPTGWILKGSNDGTAWTNVIKLRNIIV